VLKGRELQEQIQRFAEDMITPFKRPSGADPLESFLTQQIQTLRFEVATTIFLAWRCYGLVLTAPCAVYLTAICQKLSLCILSRGEEVALNEHEGFLFRSHLVSAIQQYEDLNDTFSVHFGPPPSLKTTISPPQRRQGRDEFNSAVSSGSGSESDDSSDDEDDSRSYDALIKSLLRSSPNGVIIDPITGYHISKENVKCHDYDAACALPASERAKIAYHLCTDEEQAVIDQYQKNKYSSTAIRNKSLEFSGFYSSTPAISREIFQSHLYQLTERCLQDHLEMMGQQPARCQIFFTAEATTILQLAVEHECVRKLRDLPT
jgi:hypothetical protein